MQAFNNYANNTMMMQQEDDEDVEIFVNIPNPGAMMLENKGDIALEFLNELCKPRDFINYPEDNKFIFPSEKILKLCKAAEDVIKN